MARRGQYLSAQEVATRLGVSPARVRQMVEEGKLPPPVALGDRAHVWLRLDIDYLEDLRQGKPLTANGSLLLRPPLPMTRIRETMITYPTASKPCMVHVRIWQGAAPEGLRSVVVVGALRDQPASVSNFIGVIADLVDRQCLQGRGGQAVWYIYTPTSGFPGGHHEMTNVILEVPPTPRPAKRAPTPPRAELPPRFNNPKWLEVTVKEVERVVGDTVECYPPSAYTQHHVTRFERQRVMLAVEEDPAVERPLLVALERLERVPATDPFAATARPACQELAAEIHQRRQALEGQPYYDGTGLPETADPDTWPSLFAARLVPLVSAPIAEELLKRHTTTAPTWPWNDNVIDVKVALLHDLHLWLDDCDQYGNHPDPTLASAVQQTIGVMRFWLDIANPGRLELVIYPATTARSFHVSGEYDRCYLKSITWHTTTVESHAHRRITKLAWSRDHLAFGNDPWGRLVAHNSERDDIIIDWPIDTSNTELPPGSVLVADNPDAPGSRPVYIQLPDDRLDLLPRQPDPAANDWSFGYSGGGPDALIEAIVRVFTLTDAVTRDRLPYGWIHDQVCHSDKTHLRVDIDELRRRTQ